MKINDGKELLALIGGLVAGGLGAVVVATGTQTVHGVALN
jgi:hypothetical protein